ncbi:peptidoglycan-binding protein [Streptomyces sp. NPDC058953]|uniref:peptidoglycan-binding protein n=1 Tax=Streptomyces sp. NPDC058953 TaxID=3346676 RepID=UPI0036979709
MRRRTGLLIGGTAVAAAVGAGALVYGAGGTDGRGDGRDRVPATAAVTRADLVQSHTVDGKIDFARRRAVKSAVPGTVTVAPREGATVTRGQALYELDDKPVTLLYGPVPAFREMKVGDRGSDVLQLERNLVALGLGRGILVDPRYDEATEAAVERWQTSLNRVPTGRVGHGHVVFQPERVTVVRADAALADRVGPDTPVLTVASTRPVVRADLGQNEARYAADGTKVEVTLPSGKSVQGRVTGTVRPADASGGGSGGGGGGGGGSGDGITVEIALDGGTSAVSGEDTEATANVRFISKSRQDVLTVPVEAIVALRGTDGGYGLQIVELRGIHIGRSPRKDMFI